MTEDEREELIYSLLAEFEKSIGYNLGDEAKFSFVAGARSALYHVSQQKTPIT